MPHVRASVLALLLIGTGCSGLPAERPEAAPALSATPVEERIRRVEHGLLPDNAVEGEPLAAMSLQTRMHEVGTPGLVIAVIENDRLAWVRGYGTVSAGSAVPVTADTVFQAGSISKPLTAAAILRLVDAGRLSLDADVNRYLRSWRVPETDLTRRSKVTIRRLLNHTSGYDVLFYEGAPEGEATLSPLQLLRGETPSGVPPLRMSAEPGLRHLYASTGYLVLQQLLEDQTGVPFPALMDQLILDPLQMRGSTFVQPPLPPELAARAALGTQRGAAVPRLFKPNMAGGGLWATADDIARFLLEMQRARHGRSAIISRQAAEALLAPNSPEPPAGAVEPRGLGFMVAGEGPQFRFGHGGFTTGFRSDAVLLGDGKGVVILTNGTSQGLIRELTRSVAREYGWTVPEYQPVPRRIVAVDPAILQAYVGEYEYPEGRNPRVGAVTVVDGVLHIEGEPMRAVADNSFFGRSAATYTFVRDDRGEVVRMVYAVPGLTLPARRLPAPDRR